MQVLQALVSGSLGQAIFFAEGALRILDAPDAKAREAAPNEITWFHRKARQVSPADPNGLPVSLDGVRQRLTEEIRLFSALDGLLVGMDRDFSDGLRRRAIVRAESLLAGDDDFARRVRERFLLPINTQEWDPSGGLHRATAADAESAAACYHPLAEGIVDRLADDIAAAVLTHLGSDVDAHRHRERILHSGLIAELALIEARRDRKALAALIFRRQYFPKLHKSDPSGQILTGVIHRIEQRFAVEGGGVSVPEATRVEADDIEAHFPIDPIIAAIEDALASIEGRKSKRLIGSAADLPNIQREIEWIGQRLKGGQVPRAEQALLRLIKRQAQRSRIEDIVKTLTAVADLARLAREYDWTWRILAALDHLGASDAAARVVRAQTLRELGQRGEALAVLEETMRRFPQSLVTRNAYAEALREVGRRDEALVVLEETIRRFRENEVAANAYGEALREVGRYEEALAIL